MYYLWDGGTIYQHLKELEEKNRIIKKADVEPDFLSQAYRLI
jgi:hypothetical protein